MRITSPKNIPLKINEQKNFNQKSNLLQDNEMVSNKRGPFQSYHTSKHTSRMDVNEEYGLNSKQSFATEPVSMRSGRSKSKHGISMSRDKTIKVQNIYQPQHFGEGVKNSENYSTKSITQASKNTKSVSRMTRATSPTITHFNQQRQQLTTKIGHFSMNQIAVKQRNSQQNLSFDFKDLKKQINGMKGAMQDILNVFPQDEQYYSGKTYQLKQNAEQSIQNYSRNIIQNDNNLSQYNNSQYSLEHKIHHFGNGKNNTLKKTIQIPTQKEIKTFEYFQRRQTSQSKFFGNCTNPKSTKDTYEQSQRSFNMCSPQKNKLNWQDVIKK